MKKKVFCILLLCACNLCNAQVLAPLPTINSNTSRLNSHNYIQQYLDNPAPDGRPSSYIINTDDIINYFNSSWLDGVTSYFHVYFGIDPTDATNTVQLIIVPTIPAPVVPGGPILMHDPNYSSAFVPCLNSTMTSSTTPTPTSPSPMPDAYIPDNFDASSTLIPAATPTITAISLLQPISTYKPWIVAYQNIYSNANENDYIQSFSFNAEKLRSFLLNSTPTVPYLQIYLGENANLNANLNQENYTLIFMGLDVNGNHIPVNGTSALTVFGNHPMSFEACRPCPECGIQYDNLIDYQGQAVNSILAKGKSPAYLKILNEYKKYLDDLKKTKNPQDLKYLEDLNKIRGKHDPIKRNIPKQKQCKTARVKRMQNKHQRQHTRYGNRYNRIYNRKYTIKK